MPRQARSRPLQQASHGGLSKGRHHNPAPADKLGDFCHPQQGCHRWMSMLVLQLSFSLESLNSLSGWLPPRPSMERQVLLLVVWNLRRLAWSSGPPPVRAACIDLARSNRSLVLAACSLARWAAAATGRGARAGACGRVWVFPLQQGNSSHPTDVHPVQKVEKLAAHMPCSAREPPKGAGSTLCCHSPISRSLLHRCTMNSASARALRIFRL